VVYYSLDIETLKDKGNLSAGKFIGKYFDLIYVLTQKEMKVRYKSNVLGYFWSISHPLVYAAVFFLAFKVVMRFNIENYGLFLVTGMFPWQWFSNSVSNSSTAFLTNSSIIKKVNFPRNIIPAVGALQDTIHFVLSIPVIMVMLLVHHKAPSLSWIYGVPLLVCIQFMMIYGIALMVSSVNLFFRDLARLTSIFMTLLFYCTPIIYPATMVPAKFKHLVTINPVAPIMMSWRKLFLEGAMDPRLVLTALVFSMLVLAAGQSVYGRLQRRFAEVL